MDTWASESGGQGERQLRFPIGSSVSIEELARDPYPLFRRLRDREPVAWAPELGMWMLTRRDDIVAVLADSDLFTTDSERSTIRDIFGRQMLSSDGPDWIRYKRACMSPFRRGELERTIHGTIRETVDDLIGAMKGRGQVDLRTDLSVPLSLESVLRVMGLPLEDGGRIHGWYQAFADALANFSGDQAVKERGHSAAAAFRSYMRPFLTGDRAAPAGSLLSQLLSNPDGDLTSVEVVSNLLIVLFGGVETADSMISTCLHAMLVHPHLRPEAGCPLTDLSALVDEILRWDAPVQSCTRFTTRATVIRGVEIDAGETVQCMLGAANRDPAWFPAPDRIDPARRNAKDHLSFGA
ncbi:MAG: cytochrome P450, partial [Gemmatimonadota bacterium]|nr:cytochrome P450 [Gemmatimonadota bacterium]